MGPANSVKEFMMNYFYGYDRYPADKIDRQENPAIVKQCKDEGFIREDENNNFRLYILTNKGREYLK